MAVCVAVLFYLLGFSGPHNVRYASLMAGILLVTSSGLFWLLYHLQKVQAIGKASQRSHGQGQQPELPEPHTTLEDGGLRQGVTAHYLVPSERWLAERLQRRMRASPNFDIAGAERKNGADALWLMMVSIVDLCVGTITFIAGVVLGFVVAVTAGLVAGFCVMGIGVALVMLSYVRNFQGSRAQRNYQRTAPPSPEH